MQLQSMNAYLMQELSKDQYGTNPMNSPESDFISNECLETLGLSQNPFVDHARDSFIFSDQKLDMCINVMIEYLNNQNSTLVLLGDIGVGKTTLLRILLRRGYQHFNFCTLRAKDVTGFEDIENRFKERWRLSSDSSIEPLESDEYIGKYIENGKHPVLIIDDAHRLDSESLDELLQLKHHVGLQSKENLGLVLSAEPKIQTKISELEQSNPAATQLYQINVLPFNATQCEKYIDFRLNQAGSTNNSLFSPEIHTEIFTKSRGLPRNINKLARETIAKLGMQSPENNLTENNLHAASSKRLAIIVAAIVGLAVIALLLINSQKSEESYELDIKHYEENTTNLDDKEIITHSEDVSTHKENNSDNAKTDVKQEVFKPYVAPLVLGPLKEDEKKPEIVSENTDISPNKQLLNSNWLLNQNKNSYTLQIVASPSKENLFSFVNQHQLKQQTAYYQKSVDNKTWYVLVYGIYENRDQAIDSISNLPEEIRKNNPYAVQLNKIHQIIQ